MAAAAAVRAGRSAQGACGSAVRGDGGLGGRRQVLSLLALLVLYWYKSTKTDAARVVDSEKSASARVACGFTGTLLVQKYKN